MGGGYSRSTYDEYGRSVVGAGNVVDDGVLIHCTMVWIRIFFVAEAKCTSSHPDLQG
jgi:hypothetical protein